MPPARNLGPCPACGGELNAQADDAGCPRCGGLWLGIAACEVLASLRLPPGWEALVPRERVCLPRHLREPTGRCPIGGEPLQPGRALGADVSVCASHGTFLEATARLAVEEAVHAATLAEERALDELTRRMRSGDRVAPWFRGGSRWTGPIHAALMGVGSTLLAPSLMPEDGRATVRIVFGIVWALLFVLAVRNARGGGQAPSRPEHPG